MSDPSQVPSGEPSNPAVQPIEGEIHSQPKVDTVKYETYQRVLGEKKRATDEATKLRKELDDRIAADETAKEAALKENQQWKELYETEAQKAQAANKKAAELLEHQNNAKKLNAILSKLPNQVPNKFWGLINTDSVLLNESGEIEEVSIQREVDRIVKDMPEIMVKSGSPNVDPKAPQANGSGTLSHDEWMKLPKADRDKRVGDVQGMPEWMLTGNGSAYHGKL